MYAQRTAAAAAADSLVNGYMTPLKGGAPDALLYYTINQVFVLSTFRGESHTIPTRAAHDECWHATILLAVVAAPSRSPLKVESLPIACGLVAWARSHYVEGGWGDGRAVCDLSPTVAPSYSTQVDVINPFHPPTLPK